MLSKIKRSNTTILEDGENVDAFWNPNSKLIVVLVFISKFNLKTAKGLLHFYEIIDTDQPQYKFIIGRPYSGTSGPGEALGVSGKYLRFKMALEIDCGAQRGIGLQDEMILSTKNPPSILSLSWDGEVNMDRTQTFADMDPLSANIMDLKYMTVSYSTNILGWVTSDGIAWIAHRSSMANNSIVSWKPYVIDSSKQSMSLISNISINDIFSLISLGTESGEVLVYSMTFTGNKDITFSFSHAMILSKPDETPTQVNGTTSCLAWSSDGYALAAGWESGGVAVFSVYGHLLMSTFTDEIHGFSPAPADEIRDEFFAGVKELFWGPGNFDLFLLPFFHYDRDIVSELYVLQFAKSSLTMGINAGNSRNMLLISDDKLFIYEGNFTDIDVLNLDPLQWESVQLPSSYLTSNWPITCVSMDVSGQYVAISGALGLAHYSILSGRWKLFGNELQEKSFTVNSMIWVRNILIASCEDLLTQTHEIRFFPRDINLDTKTILCSIKLSSPLICMNNCDNLLVVYTNDNIISFYSLYSSKNNRVIPFLHQQISFKDVILDPAQVRAIERKAMDFDDEVAKKVPIVILYRDNLLCFQIDNNGVWNSSLIAEKVEMFWSNILDTTSLSDAHNFLWTFHGSRIQIWTDFQNFQCDDLLNETKNHEILIDTVEIHSDFYPLTVLTKKGILAGVDQQMSVRNSMRCSLFRILSKTTLFVHIVLKYYLSRGQMEESLIFAQEYKSLSYFGHALELLLHLVLEEDYQSKAEYASTLLIVLRFLENFPQYLDIIVNCARKSEMCLWKDFFDIVGDPKSLFKQCMDSGNLSTATSYLIIIQTLEPYSVSGKLAIELLLKSLELEDFEIGKEIVRFANSIKEGETEKLTDSAHSLELRHEMENNSIKLEEIVEQHAYKLLMLPGQIRTLGRFAASLSFKLSSWLKTIKAVQFIDWFERLLVVHDKFGWPHPVDLDSQFVSQRSRRRDSFSRSSILVVPSPTAMDNGPVSPRLRSDSDPPMAPIPLRNNFKRRSMADTGIDRHLISRVVIDEVIYLQKAFFDSGHFDWAVVFSTLLLDHDTLFSIFRDGKSCFPLWQEAIDAMHSNGYTLLNKKIEDSINKHVMKQIVETRRNIDE